MATIRQTPEDFLVDEVPLYPPHGEGPFTLLHIEKRLRNSEDVATEIAERLGLEERAVGYAGRKDRRAVTRQWMSVPDLDPDQATALDIEGVTVLEAFRHRHPLRPGDLEGNRFRITVREVEDRPEQIATRVETMHRHGMPNRFGRQRYGRHGDNADLGRRVLAGERMSGPRRREGLFLSALQSLLFDEVLRRRGPDLGVLLNGDIAWHHETQGLRPVLRAADHQGLADQLELSPTGPILGHKMRAPKGKALELEKAAAHDLDLPWIYQLPRLRRHHMSGGRRPLRIVVRDLEVATIEPGVVLVSVLLPPGSYATVLLEELFPETELLTETPDE
ncbi:MAG: tRNA pseudouridine(13) synthase TruD [Thermoanaerobaculia bacterium]|nr:tRNA pseudouridine(13) synthase TruD [Thermoanaerobaculia bacterium]